MARAKSPMFSVSKRGATLTVIPQVNLSEFLFEGMIEATRDLVDHALDPEIRFVIVDFHQTKYFGTDFITVLLKLWRPVRQREGKMILCNLSESELEVLRICELHKIWTIVPTMKEAEALAKED